LVTGVLLVRAGFGAAGALAALPTGLIVATGLGMAMVWYRLGARESKTVPVSVGDVMRYTGATVVGIVSLAALTNMDALAVKHYYSPTEAGNYALAVTLGKIVLFLPASFAVVLLPKSTERHIAGRDSSRLLRLSLAVTLLPCVAITALCFVFPSPILQAVFGRGNPYNAPVPGVVALAMTGYALVNVWLNYFLSIEERGFAYVLFSAVIIQGVLLALLHQQLVNVPSVVAGVSAALLVIAEVRYRTQGMHLQQSGLDRQSEGKED